MTKQELIRLLTTEFIENSDTVDGIIDWLEDFGFLTLDNSKLTPVCLLKPGDFFQCKKGESVYKLSKVHKQPCAEVSIVLTGSQYFLPGSLIVRKLTVKEAADCLGGTYGSGNDSKEST